MRLITLNTSLTNNSIFTPLSNDILLTCPKTEFYCLRNIIFRAFTVLRLIFQSKFRQKKKSRVNIYFQYFPIFISISFIHFVKPVVNEYVAPKYEQFVEPHVTKHIIPTYNQHVAPHVKKACAMWKKNVTPGLIFN